MAETMSRSSADARPERPWHASWPAHVPHSLDYPLVPAGWLLERNLERHAARVALRCLDHTTGAERAAVTYGELAARARALGTGLRELGVARGDRVALYLPNSLELVLGYYGVWQAGAVAVPVNAMSTAVLSTVWPRKVVNAPSGKAEFSAYATERDSGSAVAAVLLVIPWPFQVLPRPEPPRPVRIC